jgi:hypothetical protein
MGRSVSNNIMVGFELKDYNEFVQWVALNVPDAAAAPAENSNDWIDWLSAVSDFVDGNNKLFGWADYNYEYGECYGYWVGMVAKGGHSNMNAYYEGGGTSSVNMTQVNKTMKKMQKLYPNKTLGILLHTYIC